MADEKPQYKVYRSRPRLLRRSATATTRWPSCARPRRSEDARRRAARARRASGPPRCPGAAAPSASRSGRRKRISPWPHPALGPRRARRLGRRSRPSCSWSPRRSSAATSTDEVGPQLERRPLPADRREHDPRARLRRALRATSPSPAPAARAARTRSCCCGSAAAPTPRSRSRATPSSTSPATGRTRSTPPTRSAAPRSRPRPSRSSSASRSTTSSRSASRTSPQLIDALGGVTYKGDAVLSKINGGNATAATRSGCPRARRRSTASRRSRSPARARTCATRPRTT